MFWSYCNCMFYKITNQDEIHNGYQYQSGLNVLDKRFEPRGSCVSGGLYYTDLNNLHDFYCYGCWIREISIPGGTRMVQDPDGNKWRADRIILGRRYKLHSIKSFNYFGLKANEDYILGTCRYGSPSLLDHIQNQCLHFKYISFEMDYINEATCYNRIDILRWFYDEFRHSFLDMLRDDFPKLISVSLGSVNEETIEWLMFIAKKNQICVNPNNVIEQCSRDESISYNMTFLSRTGFFCYTLLKIASHQRKIEFLKWLKNSGIPFKCDPKFIDYASSRGHVDVLQWWKDSGLPFNYTKNAFDNAALNHELLTLNWWYNSGLRLKYSDDLYSLIKKNKRVKKWWKSNKIPKICPDRVEKKLQKCQECGKSSSIDFNFCDRCGMRFPNGVYVGTAV